MPFARDEAGTVWEVDAAGNALRAVPGTTPATPSAGRIFTLPISPKEARQQAHQDAVDARDARMAPVEDAQRNATLEATRLMNESRKRDLQQSGDVAVPGDVTLSGDAYLRTLPPALAAQVKAMSDGRRAFPTGAALRSPAIASLVAAATQYDPTLDAANASTRMATRKDATSGPTARNITAINTSLGHLGTLWNSVDGMHNRGVPAWNTVANAIESATGDPRVAEFNITRHAVVDELEKAFRGSGGTQSGIEEWKQSLNSSQSPAQMRASIRKGVELLNSRLDALGSQYSTGMGKSSNPLELLNPHARTVFTALAPGGSGEIDDGGSIANQHASPEVPGQPITAPPKDPPVDRSNLPPINGAPTPQMEIAQGGTRQVRDDRATALTDSLIRAGAGVGTINAALKAKGFTPVDQGLVSSWQSYLKQNPAYRGPISNATTTTPNSLLQRAAGSPLGSFVAQAGNAATGGTLSTLAGEQGKGNLDAMMAANPNASMAGMMAGGVAGAGALELGAARAVPGALTRFAPRIADALYGGLSGANDAAPGDGITGGLKGALGGLAGGLLGDRIMRAGGAAVRGVTDPGVQRLRALGVPMTVGQAASQSGRLGGVIKSAEDAATSVPGVGTMINARHIDALEGLNRAAFDQAGQPIRAAVNATGPEGIGALRQATGGAYDAALDPVRIDAMDPQLHADMVAVGNAARAIPDVNQAQTAALASLENRIGGAIDDNAQMSGRGFQEAYRGLARTGRERASGDYGHEVGQVMRQGQDALAGALERQNPGAFGAFRDANSAHRNMMTLASAVDAAKNQTDNLFTPAQLNRADAMSTRRLEGPLASAAGDRPFHQLATDAQAVLPSKVPNSGTADRMMVAGLLSAGGVGGAGAGYAAGDAQDGAKLGFGGAALLAALGTRTGQHLLTGALLNRPDAAVRVGNQIDRNARIGGWGGTALGSILANASMIGN